MAELMKNRSNLETEGLFRSPSCTDLKLGMGTELKLGMAFQDQCDKEMGLLSWTSSVNGGAERAVADCIPRLPPATIPENPSRAQLTIFYAGRVYVYDDIPTDKAQALILMANSGSYPHHKVESGWGSQVEKKISVPVMKLPEGSVIHLQPASPNVRTGYIPIAKKHSLQRFLEKRHDRVNAKTKCPYKTAEADNGETRQDLSASSSPISLHLNSLPI